MFSHKSYYDFYITYSHYISYDIHLLIVKSQLKIKGEISPFVRQICPSFFPILLVLSDKIFLILKK
jgi:hypothetical protein